MPTTSEGGTSYDTSLLPVDGVDDLVNADTYLIGQLASDYANIADAAQQAAATLRGGTGGVVWEGQAAVEFHDNVGKVPGDLDTVNTSYASVANALNIYEPEVASAQSSVYRILDQLSTAHANLTTAQGNLASAKSSLTSAQSTQSNAPAHQSAAAAKTQTTAVTNAGDSVTSTTSALNTAQGEIDQLVAQGRQVVEGFTSARSTAASAFKTAGHGAPQKGFWDRVLGDVENFMQGAIMFEAKLMFGPVVGKYVGDFEWDMAKGVADTVVNAVSLPGAIANFAMHPSLHNLEQVGTDAVAAATIVLLVTGVGQGMLATDAAVDGTEGAIDAAGAAGDADEAATATSAAGRAGNALHTVNEFADTNKYFKAGLNGVSNASNYGNQAQGLYDDADKGQWGAFGRDLALDAGSDAAGKAIDGKVDGLSGAGTAEDQHAAAEAFAKNVENGSSNIHALSQLNHEQRTNLLQAAGVHGGTLSGNLGADRSLINSLNPNSLVHSSTNNLIHATTKAGLIHQVTDPGLDTATDRVSTGVSHVLHIPESDG